MKAEVFDRQNTSLCCGNEFPSAALNFNPILFLINEKGFGIDVPESF